MNNKRCLLCKKPRNTVYWHINDNKQLWCWCNGCGRSYTVHEYCHAAGISLNDFLKGNFDIENEAPNEVNRIEWPLSFIPLGHREAQAGRDYIIGRGLTLEGDMYYDTETNGVVFPMYFDKYFCGAQIRLIDPWDNGENVTKMISLPGTRTSILIYNWNQGALLQGIKYIVLTEGAFNALSIMQSMNETYGGLVGNPWKVMALSGSGGSTHHIEVIKGLKDKGYKIVAAFDTDEAGLKALNKFNEAEAVSHFANVETPNVDWNDKLKELGHKEFAKYFLGRIVKL